MFSFSCKFLYGILTVKISASHTAAFRWPYIVTVGLKKQMDIDISDDSLAAESMTEWNSHSRIH